MLKFYTYIKRRSNDNVGFGTIIECLELSNNLSLKKIKGIIEVYESE